MSDRVLVEVADHVATVTLNRPEKLNALDPEMFDAISDTGNALAARTDVRAIILRGAGGNFSAGLDVSGMGANALSDFPLRRSKVYMARPRIDFSTPYGFGIRCRQSDQSLYR